MRNNNVQNYGFLFNSSREMSSAEKTAKAKESFLDAIRNTQKTEQTTGQKLSDIKDVLNSIKSNMHQDILGKIKDNMNLDEDEWHNLLDELLAEDKIRQEDYQAARFRLIPLGYHKADGSFVKYDTENIMSKRLQNAAQGVSEWEGNPVQHLKNWIADLKEWKAEMAKQRLEEGSLQFAPIDEQIDSLERILEELLAML